MTPAPIALFAYNRPAHTRQAIESLALNPLAASSHLHIFSDGPKDREMEATIAEVRKYLRTIEGFASVTIVERERNLGLANSIIDGVSNLCKAHGRAIVLEDDLQVAPGFLAYHNAALERYQDSPEVMQISAHMFPVDVPGSEDAFFLPFVTSWGWATWDRAWRKLDPQAGAFDALRQDRGRRREFNMDGAYDYYSMLVDQLEGRIDSWAIRWNLSVFVNEGMVLYPRKTLVLNKGFDGSGMHCRPGEPDQHLDEDFSPHSFPAPGIDPLVKDSVFGYFRSMLGTRAKLRAVADRWLP